MRGRLLYLFERIFRGRCGFDELSRFLMCMVPFPLILSVILQRTGIGYVSFFLFAVAMVLFVWSLWRAYSQKLYNRKRENDHFISSSIWRSVSGFITRLSQSRDYRFYRCPGCRRWLRLPRGKGNLKITCPGCGTSFIKKT